MYYCTNIGTRNIIPILRDCCSSCSDRTEGCSTVRNDVQRAGNDNNYNNMIVVVSRLIRIDGKK